MPTSEHQAVVVTGTSSGIGHACALRLAHAGFTVFASVRKLTDADSLLAAAPDRIVPLQLDVTKRESIVSAARSVTQTLRQRGELLAGLVNNAGIGLSGPLEFLRLDDVEHMLDVNILGQVAVTQAFLPLLRQSRGRIVNICSVGDRIAIPFGGILNGTKSAFAMISESLRLELRPWGLHVVIIEPGAINTPAVEKTLGDPDGALRGMDAEAERYYGRFFREFTKRAVARERDGSSPDVVADAVFHALRDPRPRQRYVVGKHARVLTVLPRLVPSRMLDRLRMKLFGLPTRFAALADPLGRAT
jgi:NAD(P)-dependent dehydrogenase (short-subunit alcohol dehydrogenase family)